MNCSTLCVGADIHLDEIVLRGVDKASEEEVIERFRVTNNLPGAQLAITVIAQVALQRGYSRIEIGWEATGMLWIPFHRALGTSPLLHPFELQLVCFNPKLVAKFKDSIVLRTPKDDDRDSYDVAARVRFGELPVSYVPGDFWQGLRRLTRYHYKLSRNLTREKMRFQSYAFLKCSDWKRVKPFSDIFGATSAALLTEFTAAELRDFSHDQLTDIIAHRGRGRFHDPHATARAVQQALHTSYPIDPQMDDMVTATLATGWEHIRFLKRLMKRLDQHIARHIDPVPNPLITVKGLGAVITAGILAEIVDISRFPEHRHLAQFCGLTWQKRSSGGFVSQNTRLTKVGNVYLRYYFILGADQLRKHNLEYKAYYWRKHQQVSKYQHKRALVLTARKLVRLVHALLTKNVPYVRPRMPITFQQEVELLQ
ncbi:MAG: IS110 family transposase [Anaerolineales bacterium]|nr:MAG: IS110 family transposase [Anaerolineales bacterium]